ncbi:unnamed protein product [Heterobilharzia americana]|nr:unnamed protein product [Heterobilharzia americana]
MTHDLASSPPQIFKTKTIKANNQLVRLQIWDTAGQEKFRSLTKSYYRDTSAVLLVYDICKKDSFIHIKSWMSEISANLQSGSTLLVIVANKIDEEKGRVISRKEGERLAKETDALFWETSAKTGANVESMFHNIAEQLLKTKIPTCSTLTAASPSQINGVLNTSSTKDDNDISGKSPKFQSPDTSNKLFSSNCCPL